MLSYVLLEINPLFQKEITQKLKRYDFTIDEIIKVRGSSKVLARVITNGRNSLKHFILDELHPITGVKKVNTLSIQ